jgi:hypothetical protein
MVLLKFHYIIFFKITNICKTGCFLFFSDEICLLYLPEIFARTAELVTVTLPLLSPVNLSKTFYASSHASSDSPVTAACTAQKLLLNACEIVV